MGKERVMNYWCESCARKNLCYVADDRPKCFVPITSNDRTADRKTEPQICETCRHWKCIAKEFQCETTKCQGYEPQTEMEKSGSRAVQTARCLNCHNAKACKEKHWEVCRYEPWKLTAVEDEPQTDCSWQKGE